VTGRIKFGTESNGVDGGILEDVTINNIAMRDVTTAPIFLRLGSRMRGPEGVAIGKLRRIQISNLTAYDVDPRYACIIAGIEGHPVEDVKLSNIRIHYRGGGTRAESERTLPENASSYPEPSMFGVTPSFGFFIRHATGVEMNNIDVRTMEEDQRPAFALDDVRDVDLINIKAQQIPGMPSFKLNNVEKFTLRGSRDFPDMKFETVKERRF
jgi:polygalacturonase